MRSPRGWGQQHAGTPRCSCITGSHLSPYYSSQSVMSNSCLMILEFLIVDVFFLNFDALTHLFLQPLACVTEFQLRGRGGMGFISRVRGGDRFGSDGTGQGSGSTFVPVQFCTRAGETDRQTPAVNALCPILTGGGIITCTSKLSRRERSRRRFWVKQLLSVTAINVDATCQKSNLLSFNDHTSPTKEVMNVITPYLKIDRELKLKPMSILLTQAW